jgi:ribosomal protein S18 acetylase RimI-like enzyme
VRFFNELDKATLHNYSHFGYATDGRKASASIFRDLRCKRLAGYVLLVDGTIVGFGHLDFFPKKEKRHVVRLGIVLHPRYQGKGFGRPLLDYMIADAKRMGKEKIWLASYKDNPRAFELYRNRGFCVEGVFRKEEKVGEKYRDVISMALFLNKERGGR